VYSPTGVFKQTIYHPLALFSKYMRDGVAVKVHVDSPTFGGETLPTWISTIKGAPKDLDASAVLVTSPKRSVRVAVVNRSETQAYEVPLRIAFEGVVGEVEVHELWHEDVKARNGWGHEDEVSVKTRKAKWEGKWTFREHSFTLLVLEVE
jgi:alpha-N-arabinofuranosidase